MAVTLLDRADIAAAPNFVKRVQEGSIQVAGEVLEEDPETTNHDQRVKLAHQVLATPTLWPATMAQRIVLNENVGDTNNPNRADAETEEGDGALLYVLRQIWNDYAATL